MKQERYILDAYGSPIDRYKKKAVPLYEVINKLNDMEKEIKELKEKLETLEKDNLVCEDCGCPEDVELDICPYAKEINNEEIKVCLCKSCYSQRCMEI